MPLPQMTPIHPVPGALTTDDAHTIYELKYDGYRGLLYLDGLDSYFRSKKNKAMPAFNRLATQIRDEIVLHSVIFDGEITVLDKNGRPDFGALMHNRGQPVYMAFDLLWFAGQDIRGLKLIERKKLLRGLTRETRWIRFVDYVQGRGREFFDLAVQSGVEGIVAKNPSDMYIPESRGTRWVTILNPDLHAQKQNRSRMFARLRAKFKT